MYITSRFESIYNRVVAEICYGGFYDSQIELLDELDKEAITPRMTALAQDLRDIVESENDAETLYI